MAVLTPDFSDKKTLEKYSSAYTLSDMEIFIFPELFYPLVIAGIMSPVLWRWREDLWFKDIRKKNFISKSNRIKQYIICLLYTSDAADDLTRVDLGGRRII